MEVNNIRVLTHSAIKMVTKGGQIIYFDPFQIKEEFKDGDIVFITHSHHDHFSPEDIAKVIKDEGTIVMSGTEEEYKEGLDKLHNELGVNFTCMGMYPGDTIGEFIKAVPAYNVGKKFHEKEKLWSGYHLTDKLILVNEDNAELEEEVCTYYVTGDTDANLDNMSVKCDVLLIPVGGKYTFDYKEAAKYTASIKPKVAIPTHYGSIVGGKDCGKKFKEAVAKLDPNIQVVELMEYFNEDN
ncbi:MAG: MBL fold metallo-hydrolase [Clostridia bacterium]|nr:MBL fold metallo-hydrolase [Clostridia bacterium]